MKIYLLWTRFRFILWYFKKKKDASFKTLITDINWQITKKKIIASSGRAINVNNYCLNNKFLFAQVENVTRICFKEYVWGS